MWPAVAIAAALAVAEARGAFLLGGVAAGPVAAPAGPPAAASAMSPAASPALGPVVMGMGADVAQTVGQRIAQDSARIGLVAENLVSVQGDINRVEKEVLGKVFNMQTMRNFFDEHKAAVDENKKLNVDMSKLSGQVSMLSTQLSQAHADFSDQAQQHRAIMAEIHSKVVEDEAVIQGLSQELMREKAIEAESLKLQKVNGMLRIDGTKATYDAEMVHHELDNATLELRSREGSTEVVRNELIKQHQYGELCHQRVAALQDELHILSSKQQAEKVIVQHALQTVTTQGEEAQQTMAQRNAVLKARLLKAQMNVQTFQSQLTSTQQQLRALQHQAALEVGRMDQEATQLTQHIAIAESALATQLHNRKLAAAQMEATQVAVATLEKQMLSSKLSAETQENAALKGDLLRLQAALREAQVGVARAQGQAVQAAQEAQHFKATAVSNAQAAQTTAREALAQIAKAKQGDDAAAKATADATMDAEASVMTKCSTLWDKKHAKVFETLDKCKQQKQDLKSMSAQVSSLKETMGDSGGSDEASE